MCGVYMYMVSSYVYSGVNKNGVGERVSPDGGRGTEKPSRGQIPQYTQQVAGLHVPPGPAMHCGKNHRNVT